MLIETGFAKINLALHIRRRRGDGYHELETIFAFLDKGDILEAVLGDALSLDIEGEFAADLSNGPDNLILRAAQMLREHYNVDAGAKLRLQKNLPIASGIGGGSADAAAAARLLNRLWQIDAPLSDIEILLAPLGADIPACVQSATVRGMGTGTQLSSVSASDIAALPVLLINPRKPVSTGPIFAAWNGEDGGAITGDSVREMMLSGRNDLQAPAIAYCPDIADVLNALEQYDPLLARMSGSGATCFALFEQAQQRDLAFAELRRKHPQWWFMAGAVR